MRKTAATARSTSDLSPKHQTSEISLKTSDLMLTSEVATLVCAITTAHLGSTARIQLDQWFPTGVPRHHGVPFTVPRGAAG